jgi:hypothetical protein
VINTELHVTDAPAAAATGGISITPAMAVLQELAATQGGRQLPILLLWSFRSSCELELLCPPLLALARGLGLQLTPRLFYTGEHSSLNT